MSNTIRIKRRANGGGAGAPTELANAELAFNEQTNVLYYGTGTGGAGGSATSIIPIAGSGAFVDTSTAQTVGGVKTFTDEIVGSVSGNAGTATALETARDISLSGDATGTASFDGTANATIATTLANSGVTAGSYGSSTAVPVVTVDAKGRVTNVTTSAITGALDFTGDVTGSGQTGTPVELTIANTGVTAGEYTKLTVNAKGQVTSATQARLNDLNIATDIYSMGGNRLVDLGAPVNPNDAVTKEYADNIAQGLDAKPSVKCATTGDIALADTPIIDGVQTAIGDRVLVKNQSQATQNGIYVLDNVGGVAIWHRAPDCDTWASLVSAYVFVEEGTTQADTGWVCTINSSGTLNQDPVTFVQFSGAGAYTAGDGLALNGTVFSAVGTANRITSGAGGIDIASTYVGQTSITTLGTVTSGTWNATTIGVTKGGTGVTTLTGLVKGNGTAAFSAAVAGTDYLSPSSTIDGGTF